MRLLIPPFCHEIGTLEYDGWFQCCPIGTDSDNSCDILSICSTLLMLNVLPSPTNNSLSPLIWMWKSTLIHTINVLQLHIEVRNELLDQFKPMLDDIGIQSMSMLWIKWFTPMHLQRLMMKFNELVGPVLSHRLIFRTYMSLKNLICEICQLWVGDRKTTVWACLCVFNQGVLLCRHQFLAHSNKCTLGRPSFIMVIQCSMIDMIA